MAAGIDWFRWHHGTVTDPKFQLVARRSGASLPDVLAIWAALLEAASQSTPRGSIGSFDPEAYDVLFNFPEPRSAAVLEALTERGLLKNGVLTAWEKRQPKREREADDSTERVRKHRAGKKGLSDVTPRNTSETKETPREEKSREEVDQERSHSAGAGAHVTVTDGAGKPTNSPIATLTASQSAQMVLACRALRKMGAAPRINPGDEVLAALLVEGFTAEQVVRVVGEKAQRDAGLWDDPDLTPDLAELLINGASQADMRLTNEQHGALRSAVAGVSIGYIAATLRGRRNDAQTNQGPSHAKSQSGSRESVAERAERFAREGDERDAARERDAASGIGHRAAG